jgi:hypothetical protein
MIITINITELFIYILVFIILYNICYWYITLTDSRKVIEMYKFTNRIFSVLVSILIILLFRGAYILFSFVHITYTL